jgi:predicted nucleic acid-binding protein
MLVVDSSTAILASHQPDGFDELGDTDLLAPPLLWSEFRSSVHAARWRGQITLEEALRMRGRFRHSPVKERRHTRLDDETWRVAEEMGWAKTFDAEYVALAGLLGCRLVTADARLRRGADRLGFVIGPTEL